MSADPTIQRLGVALLATLVFWLSTFRTHYPFLVDDYIFLAKSYEPNFGIKDFSFIFAQRPLASFINYLCFRTHLFEWSHFPFLLYFFVHCLGLLGIFDFLLGLRRQYPGGDQITALAHSTWGVVLCVIICLFPGWFEVNLMALNLPYGLGVFFLMMALRSTRLWVRTFWLFLAFSSLETYVLPAFLLLALEAAVQTRALRYRPLIKAVLPAMLALLGYLLLQRTIAHFVVSTDYQVAFSFHNAWTQEKTYLQLLWGESFYKMNWVSTAVEWLALLWAGAIVWQRGGRMGRWLILGVILLPTLSAQHCLILAYYAPRAIHGASILRAISCGILALEFFSNLKNSKFQTPFKGQTLWLILLAIAYLSHTQLVVFHRIYNRQIIEDHEQRIIAQLDQCVSPCDIWAGNPETQMKWDWYMRPLFHHSWVKWIAAKNGIRKEIRYFP